MAFRQVMYEQEERWLRNGGKQSNFPLTTLIWEVKEYSIVALREVVRTYRNSGGSAARKLFFSKEAWVRVQMIFTDQATFVASTSW